MPQRPREHQLEDESYRKFEDKLPSEWVFRKPEKDYGVDGEVEIFDKNDNSTGYIFLVQLKGTDTSDYKSATKVTLKLHTCGYFRSLDLPVLIVRYQAPTTKLYTKWFHSFDPYDNRGGKKTITFRFKPEDEWYEGNAEKLKAELEVFRQLKSSHFDLPIKLGLTLEGSVIHGVPALEIESKIRQYQKMLPGFFAITSTPLSNAHGNIVLSENQLEILLVSGAGFILHTSKNKLNESTLPKFVSDVFVGISIALYKAKHVYLSSQIISKYAVNSSLIADIGVASILVQSLIQARLPTTAQKLLELLLKREEILPTTEMFVWPIRFQMELLSDDELKLLEDCMKQLIERSIHSKEWKKAAIAHYNFGGYLRQRKNLRLALHHYRKATEYWPDYLKMSYFCREAAGALFEKKRYKLSVELYKYAVTINQVPEYYALYADALLFAGKYAESKNAFKNYFQSSSNILPEWELKAWILSVICQIAGGEQKRNIEIATKIATPPDEDISATPLEDYESSLNKALQHDAICSLAWSNLGILQLNFGDQISSFFSFLAASLFQRSDDPLIFCLAIVSGFQEVQEVYEKLLLVVRAAYQIHHERLIECLLEFSQNQKDFPVEDIICLIREILSATPEEEDLCEVRLLGADLEFSAFKVERFN